jgi:hypothetical protein
MQFWIKRTFLLAMVAIAALALQIELRAAMDVLWLDFDMKNIPEPKDRGANFYDNFFREQLFEEGKQDLDVPRWFRYLAGVPKPAMNVNTVEEVPDSSWFTNRHHLRHMNIEELARGPNRGAAPDFDQATITKAKNSGVTVGLQLKDKKGDTYFVKFDQAEWPELQSSAELISTKILYAAGYNVPENYLAYVRPDRLIIGDGIQLTSEDLTSMFLKVARMPDGRYRVLASKMLEGKPKGPFAHIGIRHDDPNDLIPHEHRRELRGLRVIASWINHWDMKEEQSLDMYVEEHGRKFLRHYLIDFGSTLGGGQHPLEGFRGHQHVFDFGDIMHELFTLGIHDSVDEKEGVAIAPQVGMFSSKNFDPENWKTTYPVMAFQNMTDEDAFWAMRIILSFSETELRKIVETAEYTDPKTTDYILQTLLERRRIVADHWLRQVNPIARFSVERRGQDIALKFRDFMIDLNLADSAETEYVYRVKGNGFKSDERTVRDALVPVDQKAVGDEPIAVTIRTRRAGTDRDPVTIYLFPKPGGEFIIGRISRG